MTVLASDYTTRFVEGFAQLLAAKVDPSFNVDWQTTGKYATGKVGIFIAAVPTTPDTVITLTPTFSGADPTLSIDRGTLQIRYRAGADIRVLWALRDAVRYVLAGRFPMRLPTGVYVSSLVHASGLPLGQDASQRWSFSDNWSFAATDPRH